MSEEQIGQIIHYFGKIKVAVIKLNRGDLKIGDTIKYTTENGEEITQKVESMQIEHSQIEIAKSGDEFGLLVKKHPKIKSIITK